MISAMSSSASFFSSLAGGDHVQERELIILNALSKGREKYSQLQSRLTRMEAAMYSGGSFKRQ
jgi:hypothetical protein